MRIVASELYFSEIFDMEFPKLPGVTANILLSAWELLHGGATELSERMPTNSEIRELRDIRKFAPVLSVRILCDMFAKGLKISEELGRSII
jgi:hypothetical protein